MQPITYPQEQPTTYHEKVEIRLEKFVTAKESKLNLKLARLAYELTCETDKSLKKALSVEVEAWIVLSKLMKKYPFEKEIHYTKYNILIDKLRQLQEIKRKAEATLFNGLDFWTIYLEK